MTRGETGATRNQYTAHIGKPGVTVKPDRAKVSGNAISRNTVVIADPDGTVSNGTEATTKYQGNAGVGVTGNSGIVITRDPDIIVGLVGTGNPEITPKLSVTGNSHMFDFAAKPKYTQLKEFCERRERRDTEDQGVKAVEERRGTGREEETGGTKIPRRMKERREQEDGVISEEGPKVTIIARNGASILNQFVNVLFHTVGVRRDPCV